MNASVRPSSKRAAAMPRSAIREIMGLAAGRPNVIHLEVGEPDFTTPASIVDGAFAAVRSGWTKYSPNAGLPTLRQAVAEHVSRRWTRQVGANEIGVTHGREEALVHYAQGLGIKARALAMLGYDDEE